MKSTIPENAFQERPDVAGRLRILAVYGQTVLWSMGEGKGAVSFTRTLESLATRGHEVRVSLPAAPQDEPGIVPYRGFFLHHASAAESFIPRARLPLPHRLWERARLWMRYQEWAVARALEVADAMPPDLVLGLGAFEASAAHRVGSILGVPNATRLFGAWTPYRDRWRQIANFPERAAIQA
ncbi:MAG: hypothetical protein KC729_04650, partial [Candidatus Eisenbacteria bacterium]|nr:hypothetical protein [Candidatus Eisenbacteria bacterium]